MLIDIKIREAVKVENKFKLYLISQKNYFSCVGLYHFQQHIIGKFEMMLEITKHEIVASNIAHILRK